MDAKYLQAGLAHVDQEHINVSANTVTFNIADPDKGIPGCKDRDLVKFAMSMYESVRMDHPYDEAPKMMSSFINTIYWVKAFMWVVRNGPEARQPRVNRGLRNRGRAK